MPTGRDRTIVSMVSAGVNVLPKPRSRRDVAGPLRWMARRQSERLVRARPPGPPRRWRTGVPAYRAFVAAAFVCIVLLDAWADLNLPAFASTWIVGPASVVLWALT